MSSSFRTIKNNFLLTGIGLTFVLAALVVHPSDTLAQSANRSRAINLVRQAAAAYGRGDVIQTIRLCRQAIAVDPTYPRAYNWLGAAEQRRGARAGACSAFAKAVKLAPKSADATRANRGLRELKCNSSQSAAPKPTSRPTVIRTPTPFPTAVPTPLPSPVNISLESDWKSTAGITSLAFSSDSSRLSASSMDGIWRLWRIKGSNLEKQDRGDASEGSVAASGKSSYAMGTVRGGLFIFDGDNGRKRGEFESLTGSVNGIAYSPNNEHLAIVGMDNALKIFDLRSNSFIARVSSEGQAFSGITFSPDGRFLATGFGADIRVYNSSNWKLSRTLKGDQLPVRALAWSRDGNLLAASSSNKIAVWDVKTNRVARNLTGHTLTITALTFGEDSLLASSGLDSQLRLWNASSGASAGTLTYHSSQIRGLAFNSNGKRLASGDQSGKIAIWRLP